MAQAALAETTPHPIPAKEAARGRPVDLVHLARQSLGDRDLEREILSLFASQSKLYLDRLENGGTADQKHMAAHTILGSARGIGAWRVAKAAEAVQSGATCQELHEAIDEANAFITALLAR